MGQQSSRGVVVQGTVAPGFESVKEMFQQNFARGAEDSAQLCVYLGDKKVVDLWGSASDPSYTADTLTTVFSSTKSLTAIAMASLVDQGLLSYGERISRYWPEFAEHGKEEVTVADLMRHEAGLASLDTPVRVEDTWTENIKKNAIGSILEKEQCRYPEGQKREYHAITRGWVANEIFRRVDPKGRTIGEYLSEEVAGPLQADVFVGVAADRLQSYAPVHELQFSRLVAESMKTKLGGSAVDVGFFELLGILNAFRKLSKGISKPAFAQYKDMDMTKFGPLFNTEDLRRGETSSANGNCSARGLALVAAALANKGTVMGVEVLSEAAWEQLHRDPVPATIFNIFPTNFSQGGVNKFEEEGGRGGYWGWYGYGGSVFQWQPDLKLGFAYTPSLLYWFDGSNNRGRMLQQEVAKCARNVSK